MKIHDIVTDSSGLKKIIKVLSDKGTLNQDICVIITVPDFQKDEWMGKLLLEQLEPFIKILRYKIES